MAMETHRGQTINAGPTKPNHDEQRLTWSNFFRPVLDLLLTCWYFAPTKLLSFSAAAAPTRASETARVTGTIICTSDGDVRLCFQTDPTTHPYLLVDLPLTPAEVAAAVETGVASIALECAAARGGAGRWRAWCNGRRLRGSATRRAEVDATEAAVLEGARTVKAGAGVIGGATYVRGEFERVGGGGSAAAESEAYHLVEPERGGPDGKEGLCVLSVFFIAAAAAK
ncbi:hypothetical protein QJS04_geneDACA006590 [Acorus gramineus]|uniref:Uncharacterized protein n=1 Tax=Acorus gramineus TaxID=55184 RepID=A0AAV9AVX7_ACOGR|nr:hypothetical protein QJS04_geneDACA006590 [Acorus gramineus]